MMGTGTGTEIPRVLLVDGMSVLVRAAKAAQRVKPLSYEGTQTGTMMMFAGTMTKHLAVWNPDHVVVAWEGVPGMNWRKEKYPQYKSSRPSHADDATAVMSRDEELAREFCAAAGLFQDWVAPYEGDDVIAAWWRAFRDNMPDAEIVILTSDRDLLQLCDTRTVCQGWHGDPMTYNSVYALWGCQPARLPLLRALAGDTSDGIPGIRGLGPARASKIARTPGRAAAVIASLDLDEEQKSQVLIWYEIINLRNPQNLPVRIRADFSERQADTLWHPAAASAALREFLDRFGMRRMTERLDAGRLPWPPVPE